MKPCIVISAVNFVEGGPLSILRDCLSFASRYLSPHYDVVALVHKASLLNTPEIRFIEFPKAKSSWLARLNHEYRLFHRLSLQLKPLLWFSLHDMTPNVAAVRRAVYCHNPAPFYRLSWRDIWLEPSFAFFNLFYRWLYQINIHKNDYVIVQQDWLRGRFKKMFELRRVIVAYPEISIRQFSAESKPNKRICRFFYPAFPRVFKNYELVGEAARILVERGIDKFEVLLTIDGSENRYSNSIIQRFGKLAPLKFIGLQDRNEVFELYSLVDCLIFPSKLETWGLPISEFMAQQKPILAADLEYAHETVGEYSMAQFFGPRNAQELADLMLAVIDDSFKPAKLPARQPKDPFARGWGQLFKLLLENQSVESR